MRDGFVARPLAGDARPHPGQRRPALVGDALAAIVAELGALPRRHPRPRAEQRVRDRIG